MFKIGDKVTHESLGIGEVIETGYVRVAFGEGPGKNSFYYIPESELKAAPKYPIGQTVTTYNGQFVVLSDVFVDSDGHRSYVMRDGEGDCLMVSESSIQS
jgi:hypothetical protein